jgi:hypothetical protein
VITGCGATFAVVGIESKAPAVSLTEFTEISGRPHGLVESWGFASLASKLLIISTCQISALELFGPLLRGPIDHEIKERA